MAPLILPTPTLHKPQKRDFAWNFIASIESSWKGHEKFAAWLIEKTHPKIVVDLGFDRGLSTLVFAYRNRGQVFAIDWFEEGNYAEKSFALELAFQNISHAIFCKYVKNLHLIIGPFDDVVKNWRRRVDLLHIDSVSSYATIQRHYNNWLPFLMPDATILVHDVLSQPEVSGRFFQELALPKILISHSKGLGIASNNTLLIETIRQTWHL